MTRYRFLRLLRAAVVAAACVMPVAAWAQSDAGFPNADVGVIDMQEILGQAKASQAVQAERDKYAQRYQQEMATEEQTLRETQQGLALEGNQQSEAFQKKRQEFEQKVAAFQRKTAQLRQNLDRAFRMAMSQVQDKVVEKANDVAGERGINLVLYRTQLLLFDPRMSMTEEVLSRVDSEMPTVAFPDPEKLGEPGKQK